jgi:hypothetical protein
MNSIFTLISEKIYFKNTYQQISTSGFGKAWFILPNNKLVDVSDECGPGTNDHVGLLSILDSKELITFFNISPKMLDGVLKEIRGDNFETDLLNVCWDKIYKKKILRARLFESILSLTFGFKLITLREIQNHIENNRLPGKGVKEFWFEDALGERDFFRTNLEAIFASSTFNEILNKQKGDS